MRNISTIVCLGLTLALAACVPHNNEERQWTPWQLAIERQEHVVELNFTCAQPNLTVAQKQAIQHAKKSMLSKTTCYAVIDINRENAQTEKRIRNLTAYLMTLGITAPHIKVKNLTSFAEKSSELSLHLEEYEAVVPRCPGWTQAMTDAFEQNVGPGGELNFGCTTQYNLANMIAHPKDIVEPQKLGAGDGHYLGKIVDDLSKNKMSQDSSKKSSTTTSSSDSSSNN